MNHSCMTARSLFDTYFYIGMTAKEALLQCIQQGIFSTEEINRLKEELDRSAYRI